MNTLDRTATAAAFPLGGIGTGNVSIGARGELRDWELANAPGKGSHLPFTFFAIRTARTGAEPVTRVLESRLVPPHTGDQGYYAGRLAGLPRLRESRMRGEYPLLSVDFADDDLGVDVALTAFTPLVPLDADASGIPCAILRYTVTNPSSRPVDVTVVGSLANPVGITGRNVFHFPEFAGQPRNEWRDDGRLRGIVFGTDLDEHDPRFGSVALTTTDADTTAKPQWLSGFWQDGVQVFWDDLRADGRLDAETEFSLDRPPYPDWFTRLRVGSLGSAARLPGHATHTFEFVLTWHFPNRPRAWQGNIRLDDTHAGEVVRNHYATRFKDAWHVAEHLAAELPGLEAATRTFHRALFGGTLPPEIVDAAAANLTVLRSTTCLRLEGGVFAAWEGSFEQAGSCEGTCTHVWNYAQTAAFLFPELERSARRTEFLHETRPDGRMNFRANSVFGNAPWDFHAAVDGQLGAVIRLYREWRFTGDDAFLAELYPGARRALDYAFTAWDADGDGVLDSEQHNTYDIEFFGPNSLANSMFAAALHAGARMAGHLGDAAAATRYREAAHRCAERTDALLFNGEYYEQRIDDVDEHRYQYGRGCLSDQLFGQLLAHVAGLGHVLPAAHVRSAVAAVHRYNFRRELTNHHSVQRTYALDDEAGLVLCSWPHGGRPRIPFVYSDEVWTGIEYQVAAHLIYEGLVEEGRSIVRAVRDRHDGRRRNPWNEVECGNHYARSLASWAPLLALSGADYDAPTATLTIRPRLDAPEVRSIFTTGTGWGTFAVDADGARLTLHAGSLDLATLTIDHATSGRLQATGVRLEAGDTLGIPARPTPSEEP
ncbi:GH116 family glycosyl hydrolase [Dactylosporangium sp. AC04546]|uniref:GH116 family glycosyl-hydrolase n=1 Tax=Dactylosporangium sp. AC04546 TaxID=2862460 RepID=UPI001EDD4C18|nr:GH116 family glycosyl-hydrolase [Dactylosporangium sp. AC04546]WVK78487.1 GH116 family glycosyl hydrolase [Dactylosporangium sp. AC04546]